MQDLVRKKVGVAQEEKKLPYYKFYVQDLAKIPQEKLRFLGENNQFSNILPFEEKNVFLEGKDSDYCQVGYGVTEEGIGFVCNTTYMPNVTSEMMDWWFPWHSVGADLRYKIWDPEDHYFATADKPKYVCDEKVPMREKTWGVKHFVLEDIGNGPGLITLNFMRPRDFGFDEHLLNTPFCESLVCAVGEGDAPAAMVHKWYTYEEGIMLCSRFWMGIGLKDGKIQKVLPQGVHIPEIAAKGLFAHNIKEFSNLAAILPELYCENKNNF